MYIVERTQWEFVMDALIALDAPTKVINSAKEVGTILNLCELKSIINTDRLDFNTDDWIGDYKNVLKIFNYYAKNQMGIVAHNYLLNNVLLNKKYMVFDIKTPRSIYADDYYNIVLKYVKVRSNGGQVKDIDGLYFY